MCIHDYLSLPIHILHTIIHLHIIHICIQTSPLYTSVCTHLHYTHLCVRILRTIHVDICIILHQTTHTQSCSCMHCVNFKLHRSNPQSHIILNISTLSKIHDQPLIQIPTSNVLCLALYKFLHMPIMTMNIRIKTKQRSSGNITISKSHPLFDPTTNQLVQKHTKTHEVKHIYTFWGGP
jgi:hypothetical protein